VAKASDLAREENFLRTTTTDDNGKYFVSFPFRDSEKVKSALEYSRSFAPFRFSAGKIIQLSERSPLRRAQPPRHRVDFPLADKGFYLPATISLILGADAYSKVIQPGFHLVDETLHVACNASGCDGGGNIRPRNEAYVPLSRPPSRSF